jgi:hypothetical protein
MAYNQVRAKRKLSIIDNWRHGWKWASVRTSALGIGVMSMAEVFGSTWAGLPPSLQEKIPHADTLAIILFSVALVGRFFKLEKKETTDDDERSSG